MQWEIDKKVGAEIDRRTRALGGESHWIRSNLEVYNRGHTLNAHDWMLLSQCGEYVFADLFPDQPWQMEALLSLCVACTKILTMTSAHDSENREDIDKLKLLVIEALCRIESVIPKTELAVMFHILLHVPDCMYKWNGVRNYWSFFGERFYFSFFFTGIFNLYQYCLLLIPV